MTDYPATLAEALAMLQADMPTVGKDNTAKVKSERTGQQYTYNYADLADCSRAILPKLGALGLSFTAAPSMTENGFGLSYTLLHAGSAESFGGFYPLPDPNRAKPQEMGSAITYARRYSLCAVTGLAPDNDDDDAAAASQRVIGRGAVDASGAPEDPEESSVSATEWREQITGAKDRDTLEKIAQDMATSNLSDAARKPLRELWKVQAAKFGNGKPAEAKPEPAEAKPVEKPADPAENNGADG
jgi:hypothetical protein